MTLFEETLASGEVIRTHSIYPWLAVGPSVHIPRLHGDGWSCVCVARECDEDRRFPGTCWKRGLWDGANANRPADVIAILARIHDQRIEHGKPVAVTCGAGHSRAPTIAAGYLVWSGVARDMMEALSQVYQRRPEIGPKWSLVAEVETIIKTARACANEVPTAFLHP